MPAGKRNRRRRGRGRGKGAAKENGTAQGGGGGGGSAMVPATGGGAHDDMPGLEGVPMFLRVASGIDGIIRDESARVAQFAASSAADIGVRGMFRQGNRDKKVDPPTPEQVQAAEKKEQELREANRFAMEFSVQHYVDKMPPIRRRFADYIPVKEGGDSEPSAAAAAAAAAESVTSERKIAAVSKSHLQVNTLHFLQSERHMTHLSNMLMYLPVVPLPVRYDEQWLALFLDPSTINVVMSSFDLFRKVYTLAHYLFTAAASSDRTNRNMYGVLFHSKAKEIRNELEWLCSRASEMAADGKAGMSSTLAARMEDFAPADPLAGGGADSDAPEEALAKVREEHAARVERFRKIQSAVRDGTYFSGTRAPPAEPREDKAADEAAAELDAMLPPGEKKTGGGDGGDGKDNREREAQEKEYLARLDELLSVCELPPSTMPVAQQLHMERLAKLNERIQENARQVLSEVKIYREKSSAAGNAPSKKNVAAYQRIGQFVDGATAMLISTYQDAVMQLFLDNLGKTVTREDFDLVKSAIPGSRWFFPQTESGMYRSEPSDAVVSIFPGVWRGVVVSRYEVELLRQEVMYPDADDAAARDRFVHFAPDPDRGGDVGDVAFVKYAKKNLGINVGMVISGNREHQAKMYHACVYPEPRCFFFLTELMRRLEGDDAAFSKYQRRLTHHQERVAEARRLKQESLAAIRAAKGDSEPDIFKDEEEGEGEDKSDNIADAAASAAVGGGGSE